MSNTQLEEQLVGQPAEVQVEIIRINTDARPIALQVALIIPLLAGLIGLFNGFRPARSGAVRIRPSADAASRSAAFSRASNSNSNASTL
jgi:hypothetical protein